MNPSANDYDDDLSAFPEVRPNTTTPRVIGTLNIIFAVGLLLCGACYGLQVILQSAMAPLMAANQQQMQATLEAQRQAQLQQLREQEKAAKTDKEKAELQAEQQVLQARPLPKMPD